MIFKHVFAKKLAFFDWKQSYIMLKLDHSIGFWEKHLFFAENCRKMQKIVITTSTPDWPNFRRLGNCFLWAACLKITYRRSPNFELPFTYGKKGWATFWVIFFPQNHPVTLSDWLTTHTVLRSAFCVLWYPHYHSIRTSYVINLGICM
jgi:hypothetical protein